jgi:hypothetical protein
MSEEFTRCTPSPDGAYNLAYNAGIKQALEILKQHLSPTHGVITEVKKLLIP